MLSLHQVIYNMYMTLAAIHLIYFLSVMCGHSGFFIPATTANDIRLRRIFYPRFYPLHFFPILILQKAPVLPFLMLSAKQGNYWYHFYYVFDMTRSLSGDWTRELPHSKPALYHKAIEKAVLFNLWSLSQITWTNSVNRTVLTVWEFVKNPSFTVLSEKEQICLTDYVLLSFRLCLLSFVEGCWSINNEHGTSSS